MNTNTSTLTEAAPSRQRPVPTHSEIEQKARELWERYGRPQGRDEEIWLEAERTLALGGSSNKARAVGSKAVLTQSSGAVASSPKRR